MEVNHQLRYPEVHRALFAAVPEIKGRYDKQASLVVDWQGRPAQYLVIEFVVKPLLAELLDQEKDRDLLKRVFEFFEQMACSSDREVINLLAVGVLEGMVNEPKKVSAAWKYMGSETKRMARQVARGLRREQNLPLESA